MKASTARRVAHWLPLPGRVIRRLLDSWDGAIAYPAAPITLRLRDGVSQIQIRDYREYIQRNIYFLGYYEIRETRLLRRLLRPGDTFVDVGANIGWYTLLAANQIGPTGKVIAFEPSRAVYGHLTHNVRLSGYSHVIAERLALADRPGRVQLRVAAGRGPGTGSILEAEAASGDVTEEVETIRFDDYCRATHLESARLVKIDVEGAELMVLRGMREALERRSIQYFIIEVADSRLRSVGDSSQQLLELLQGYGYRLSHIGMLHRAPVHADTPITFANILAAAC
jgi:FkbM family methyltransferase